MKNSFNIEVNFADVPLKPFEWDTCTIINGIKVTRVSSKTINDILSYECKIDSKNKMLLLSDTRDSIVIRMDESGKVKKRSFLTFTKDLDTSEYASNLKQTKMNYQIGKKKLVYSNKLKEEENIKNYLIKSIKDTTDEEKLKYAFYKCHGSLENYSKNKLLECLEENFDEKYFEIYELFMKNQGLNASFKL